MHPRFELQMMSQMYLCSTTTYFPESRHDLLGSADLLFYLMCIYIFPWKVRICLLT